MDWKWFGKFHTQLYRLSGGRIGARLDGLDMVLLETIGRKSGKLRTIPLACYPYKDSVIVVAGNSGLDKEPVWWLNLQQNPEIDIQLGRKRYRVRAEKLAGEERENCWQQVTAVNPRLLKYKEQVSREIAVINLKRV